MAEHEEAAAPNAAKRMFSTPTLKNIALVNYLALLIFMPLWLTVLSPSEGLSPLLAVTMFTVPLLFPLKGLLQGNPYTFAWSAFILMIYYLHSLTTLWVLPEDRLWAVIEFILTTNAFLAGTYYAKYKGQELGLSIRKKK
ncbi:DUF2069 domain-containing protein [Thalassotalea sp. PLHSN55]|uniref:DUF2069 domain-containing protein n=1 Tax=Thalassotalea sp. PLHSN55 TaxID=3435888 RepID=UPI003F85037B